jgi:hypothetical protein
MSFRIQAKTWYRYFYAVIIIGLLLGLNLTVFSVRFLPEIPPPPIPTEMNQNFLTQVNDCLIPAAAIYGYTLRISSGWRSLQEQANIYEQGRTINGHIVSEAPAGKSIHNYGYAIDVVDRWRGYDIDWKKLHNIGTFCRLENDISIDPPHFENRDGLTTVQFKDGWRPALMNLPCPIMAEKANKNERLTLADLKSCNAPKF